jgi:hypothetical protein
VQSGAAWWGEPLSEEEHHTAAALMPESFRQSLPDGDALAEYRDYATCGVCGGPMSLDEAESNDGVHNGCDDGLAGD